MSGATVRDPGPQPRGTAGIEAIVVTHESGAAIEGCLAALTAAAPRRGLVIRVVDNASRDDCRERAARHLGTDRVLALSRNGGFATGVNAGLRLANAPFVALVNPDVVVPPGALDRLADLLEAHPRAGLIGPRVLDDAGRPESSVGRAPTLAGELAHALYLERLFGVPGRHMRFPSDTGPVGWVSGCAWLLRREAIERVGPLDERYFMYYEDSDYCERLRAAGWEVMATSEVAVTHQLGRGSTATGSLPADGGIGVLHFFRKFRPEVDERRLKRIVMTGWRIRRASHAARAWLGSERSRSWVRRFDRSLDLMRNA